jgi:hypothetical protein
MPDPENIPIIGPFVNATNDIERGEIPILGETWTTMNTIVNFAEYGCYPNWTVWVDTLWPCAGKAVLSLLDFGLGDILRGYFRPTHIRGAGGLTRKPVRNRNKKAGKTGRTRRIPQPPEIGNEIGKALPGSKFFQGRKVTGKERWIWIIDVQVQRFFWYWLVFSVASEFIQCWSSAIMKSEACARDQQRNVSARKTLDGPWAPDDWHAIIVWATEDDTTNGLWNDFAGTLTVPLGMRAHCSIWGDSIGWAGGINTGGQIAASPVSVGTTPDDPTPWPVGSGDTPDEPTQTTTVDGPALIHCAGLAHGIGLQGMANMRFTATIVQTD